MRTPTNPFPLTRWELLAYAAAALVTLALCDLAPWGWAAPI